MSDPMVWLENAEGNRWPVGAACSIGRAATNNVTIEDGRVSRRHALVHRQDSEFWVIDLGSGNGTYLNGRRVTLATKLSDGDVLMIADHDFKFRLDSSPSAVTKPARPVLSEQTLIQIKTLPAWLLVADIRGSTALAQRLSTTELAVMVGKWMAACKEIIEANFGGINKYLGDGFFAYWYADERNHGGVTRTMQALAAMQRSGDDPPFRLALHHGTVTIGGAVSGGEDSLSGQDVIAVFRMEKLASALRQDVLISASARKIKGLALNLADLGEHELPQFDGKARRFYTMA